MISFDNTRVVVSAPRPVLTGSTISAEGCALVADYTTGQFAVRMSTTNDTAKFIGFAVSQVINQTYIPVMETLTIAAAAVTLSYTPVASSLRVRISGYSSDAAYNAAPAGNQHGWTTGTSVAFNATENGKVATVCYLKAVTVAELQYLQGEPLPGTSVADILQTVGVASEGDIYTSEYDTTIDWSAATTIRVGANGKVTTAGSGSTVNGYVIQVPSTSDVMLGLKVAV